MLRNHGGALCKKVKEVYNSSYRIPPETLADVFGIPYLELAAILAELGIQKGPQKKLNHNETLMVYAELLGRGHSPHKKLPLGARFVKGRSGQKRTQETRSSKHQVVPHEQLPWCCAPI